MKNSIPGAIGPGLSGLSALRHKWPTGRRRASSRSKRSGLRNCWRQRWWCSVERHADDVILGGRLRVLAAGRVVDWLDVGNKNYVPVEFAEVTAISVDEWTDATRLYAVPRDGHPWRPRYAAELPSRRYRRLPARLRRRPLLPVDQPSPLLSVGSLACSLLIRRACLHKRPRPDPSASGCGHFIPSRTRPPRAARGGSSGGCPGGSGIGARRTGRRPGAGRSPAGRRQGRLARHRRL